ncbi:MAG: hypothetical protein CBC13_06015 [Planctomycetia bacterium TMED53]|nr:MAG: hypothetical protein CBC13_06015 [Planctomycetia bacterium TMED53]
MLTFVIFAAVGHWIDDKFDTGPWGILGGCLFGFIALIVRALRDSPKA